MIEQKWLDDYKLKAESVLTDNVNVIEKNLARIILALLEEIKVSRVELSERNYFGQWINIKDKLPEKNQKVLTYNPMDDRERFWVDYLFLAGDNKLHWDMGEDNVTHWMLLPGKPLPEL